MTTVNQQKTMLSRASRLASLHAMNEQIRVLDPSEAWHPANINDAPDLDALQDAISACLVSLVRARTVQAGEGANP